MVGSSWLELFSLSSAGASATGAEEAAGAETGLTLRSCLVLWTSNRFSRRALLTTQTEERLMAAEASMGLSFQPSRE